MVVPTLVPTTPDVVLVAIALVLDELPPTSTSPAVLLYSVNRIISPWASAIWRLTFAANLDGAEANEKADTDTFPPHRCVASPGHVVLHAAGGYSTRSDESGDVESASVYVEQ